MNVSPPTSAAPTSGWRVHRASLFQIPSPAAWVLTTMLVLIGLSSTAQTRSPGFSSSGMTITRYYPAPNFKQMDLKITGDHLIPLPDNSKRIRAVNPEFWAYQTSGALLLRLRTPECLWDETDPQARTLSSTGELAVTTGDGRFHIQGRGFLWQHNERLLTISNDVRALVHWTNNAPPLVITSRWFTLDADLGRGTFHQDVRGDDTNLTFTCELLAISGTTNKTAQGVWSRNDTNRTTFDLIEADGGLEIIGKQPGQFGRAQRGVYHHADQRVELIGAAAVNFNPYAGSADRMIVWLNSTNIDATGNVKLSLPRGTLGAAGGLLSTTNAASKSASTNIVTLVANHFQRRDDRLQAEGAVRVNDGTNVLTCDRLEGKQATVRSPEEFAIATGNVFVGRQNGGIHSDRADYSKAHNQVSFTGNPRFVQGEVSGTAGRVIARTLTGEVLAEDDVAVTFPLASRHGSLLNFLPTEGTNRMTNAANPDQKAAITARTLRLQERRGVFAGNVKAHQLPQDGTEPRLRCGELEVRLAADKKHAQSLQARDEVVCERGTIGVTNGPAEYTRMDCATLTAHANPATGELVQLVADGGVDLRQTLSRAQSVQAVYTHANQVLRLIGSPRIERPDGVYRSDQELVWDNAHQVVRGSNFKITAPTLLNDVKELEKLR
jgi:lipopolysaccharide export system protein LptA